MRPRLATIEILFDPLVMIPAMRNRCIRGTTLDITQRQVRLLPPLTPALSRGERENCRRRIEKPAAANNIERWKYSPSPHGRAGVKGTERGPSSVVVLLGCGLVHLPALAAV